MERIKMLKEEGKWNPAMSVFGIPKVKAVKSKRKGKSEKKAAKAKQQRQQKSARCSFCTKGKKQLLRQLQRVRKGQEIMIAQRMSKIDSSGIRKVFDLAQKNAKSGEPGA